MLLKSGSKKARSGFQRKKLNSLGAFKEIIGGQKKVAEGTASFAQPVTSTNPKNSMSI